MNRTALLLSAVLASLLGLSLRSGFSIYDVDSMNWEIALMLSPWGYLNNLIFEANHYLAPYYQVVSNRGSLLADPLFALQMLTTTVLGFLGLRSIRLQKDRETRK